MAIKSHAFESDVFKELDLVWKTYLQTPRWFKRVWVRRWREPKLIHIYWWDEFFEAVSKSLDCNPLMRIIIDTIDDWYFRYYPIYSRTNKKYRTTERKDVRWVWTYYDRVWRVWVYEDNKVDFALDDVVWWYPPILTWMFVERPSSKVNWDLLIYFIKKWYANKKMNTSETSNWGTEGKSIGSSEEH